MQPCDGAHASRPCSVVPGVQDVYSHAGALNSHVSILWHSTSLTFSCTWGAWNTSIGGDPGHRNSAQQHLVLDHAFQINVFDVCARIMRRCGCRRISWGVGWTGPMQMHRTLHSTGALQEDRLLCKLQLNDV